MTKISHNNLCILVRFHRDKDHPSFSEMEYKTQVMEIVDIRKHEHKPRRLQEEVTLLKYQMLKIERLLRSVLLLVELPEKIKVFTDKELMFWYDEAKQVEYMEKPQFREADMEKWFSILTNLHEEEFKRLKHLLGDPAPWVPFVHLCDSIVNLAKHQFRNYRKSRSALRCSEWMGTFLMVRAQLRRKGFELVAEEPHNYSAAKRADMMLDYAHREAHPIKLGAKKGEGGSG